MSASVATSPRPVLQPLADQPRGSGWRSVAFWTGFLLIVALGGFLRFWRLDQQAYWCDEWYTIQRVSGNYRHVLNSLRGQGFPPGWYTLMWGYVQTIEHYRAGGVANVLNLVVSWWHGQTPLAHDPGVYAFTPGVLRTLPAACGTLMVPILYFLARQFTDRRGALLVALLAAVNPYLIYYSRDLKMYMGVWPLVALHVALFFHWLTVRRHWLWFPLVVLSGAAMVLMHSTAWLMVPLELIWLLTRPRLKAWEGPLWLTGVAAMAILPLYWYQYGTDWVGKVQNGESGGLQWISDYTEMSWKTVGELPCIHLLGYLWPELPPGPKVSGWFSLGGDFQKHLDTRTWPVLALWETRAAMVVAGVMVLGLIPWRGFRKNPERAASVTRGRWWWIALWIGLPMLVFALISLPRDAEWGLPPHKMIWEPRYLGLLVPAWILWLAAALRRFPTWPIRTLLIVGVVGMSATSALANHLLFRQAPWQQIAQQVGPHYEPNAPRHMIVTLPYTRWTGEADLLNLSLACNRRPQPNSWIHTLGETLTLRTVPSEDRAVWDTVLRLAGTERRDPSRQVQWLVLTDRNGDLDSEPWSDAYVQQKLQERGGTWEKVTDLRYRWHYEWRYYLFHVWRTRVYHRVAPATQPARTASAPATQPQR